LHSTGAADLRSACGPWPGLAWPGARVCVAPARARATQCARCRGARRRDARALWWRRHWRMGGGAGKGTVGLTGAWMVARLSSRCRWRRADGTARRLPRRRRRRRWQKGMRAAARWLTGGDGDGGVWTIDERWRHRCTGGGGEASAGLSGQRRGRLRTTVVGDTRGESERSYRPAPLWHERAWVCGTIVAHGSHAKRAR
jgi:hypothetical protein